MPISELLTASQDMSGLDRQTSCRLCLSSGQVSVMVGSPARKLMKCRACGVTFLDPQPDAQQISEHLTHHYITQDAHINVNFGLLRKAVLSRVAAQILKRKTHGRILDIGCAGGYFLHTYFPSPDWKLYGVEPSTFAAERAARKGLTVYPGQLLDVDLPPAFFDVVTIFDTLSYFRDPQQELTALRRAMNPDGLLVIEQPFSATHIWRHATKPGRLLGGVPMSLLESGQNFLYDVPSMLVLLCKSGFRALEFETLPGNKQRDIFRDVLFASYFLTSRLIWYLTAHKLVLGPNFAAFAEPALIS